MADIELVIKIPEGIYESSKRECEENDSLIIDTFTYAIGNGTLLPKGHGRLIDADALLKEHPLFDTYPFPSTAIDNSPTIIEADIEREEK